MKDISYFAEKAYNPRNNSKKKKKKKRCSYLVYFVTETISSLAPKIWELVPNEIKNATSLGLFKKQFKFCRADKCVCRLCNIYKSNIGLA